MIGWQTTLIALPRLRGYLDEAQQAMMFQTGYGARLNRQHHPARRGFCHPSHPVRAVNAADGKVMTERTFSAPIGARL